MSPALLLAVVLACPQPLGLEEALRLTAAGEPLPEGSVSPEAGRMAAARALVSDDPMATRRLLTVAGASRLPLATLSALPSDRPVPPTLLRALSALELAPPAARVAAILAARLPAKQLSALLAGADLPAARRDWQAALAASATPEPVPLLRALAADPRAPAQALAVLVRRGKATARAALELAQREPSPGLVRSLGHVGTEQREAVRTLVLAILDAPKGDPLLKAAAVTAGGALLLSEVADRLPQLMLSDAPRPVRRAAIQAVPALLYRDPSTLEALIALLGDRDVADVAYASLVAKAGVELPPEPTAWRQWVRSKTEWRPEPHGERGARLERAWGLTLRLRRRPTEPTLLSDAAPPSAAATAGTPLDVDDPARPHANSLGAAVPTPKAQTPSWVGWGILTLAILGLALGRWWSVVGPTRAEPPAPSPADLGLVPTRRLDRLRHSLHRDRILRGSITYDPEVRTAEAEVFHTYMRAVVRLREHERAQAPSPGHLVFRGAQRSAVDLLETTTPVEELFPPEGERTAPLSEVFGEPASEPAEETTPVSELFAGEESTLAAFITSYAPPTAPPPIEEKTTPLSELVAGRAQPAERVPPPIEEKTTPLSDLFDRAQSAEPAPPRIEEKTTPLSDLFAARAQSAEPAPPPIEEKTTPLSDLFAGLAQPAEPAPPPIEEKTTPLSELFTDDAPAEEKTTPLSELFDAREGS